LRTEKSTTQFPPVKRIVLSITNRLRAAESSLESWQSLG